MWKNDLVQRAITFAFKAHADQTRKFMSKTSYLVHPARVATLITGLVERYPGMIPYDEVIATAWLHDVLEDTLTRYETLVEQFGKTVADWVQLLTNPPKTTQPNLNRAQRKQQTLERLRAAPGVVRLIKMVDRLDNVTDIGIEDFSDSFRQIYAKESLKLMDALCFGDTLEFEFLAEQVRDIVTLWR